MSWGCTAMTMCAGTTSFSGLPSTGSPQEIAAAQQTLVRTDAAGGQILCGPGLAVQPGQPGGFVRAKIFFMPATPGALPLIFQDSQRPSPRYWKSPQLCPPWMSFWEWMAAAPGIFLSWCCPASTRRTPRCSPSTPSWKAGRSWRNSLVSYGVAAGKGWPSASWGTGPRDSLGTGAIFPWPRSASCRLPRAGRRRLLPGPRGGPP